MSESTAPPPFPGPLGERAQALRSLKARVDAWVRAHLAGLPAPGDLSYQGSLLNSVFHFPKTSDPGNEGSLLFFYRLAEPSGVLTLECSMELNTLTVRDASDQLRIPLTQAAGGELDDFVRRKVDEFRELYRKPVDLGPEDDEDA